MSAYMVDDAHIDALIDIAKQYEREYRGIGRGQLYWHFGSPGQSRSLRDQTETEIGRTLLAENARSVGYRYREVQDPAALTYVYRPTKREYAPSQALMAIRGYEYQACETPDWDCSEPHAFCRALFRRVVDVAIPQRESDGPFWTITDRFLGREESAALLPL
jgi:hypothetical protein